MIHYKTINLGLLEGVCEFPYQQPHEVFGALYSNYQYKFLFESKDVSEIYGRLSLIGVDPVLKITGKGNIFSMAALNKRGEFYLKRFKRSNFSHNIVDAIRIILKKFKIKEKTLLGLYGAFSYDFIRLFEDIPDNTPKNDIDDFTLFIYDTFIFFDHLKQKNEIIVYRRDTQEAESAIKRIAQQIENKNVKNTSYSITNPKFSLNQKEYEKLVKLAKKYAREGELFEVVFSNILKAGFTGDPFALYLKYRDFNPSPYLFYFDFNKEYLVGASPEMMVRCENNIVSLRPISGTAKRGKDPIEDHENMLKLLSDPKEKAELDMLIDLGRNDLSRVCEPRVKITDYRFVEKYSRVMHTVAHLSGKLQKNCTALDALIACLNAGTLTGAPKIAAMKIIEKHEKERRGYYGGTIGYLTFSGDMDTGIIIRTAHIKNNELKFQVGATLLYDSIPTKEYTETLNKAEAFLRTFTNTNLLDRAHFGSEPAEPDSLPRCALAPQCGARLKYKNILVIDNFDSFTFNLVDYFKQLGGRVYVYRNNIDPNLIDEVSPDLIVISPGPSIPKNAGNLMKIIDKYHKKYPIFGVCLGHEALIEYFGGSLKFIKPVHGKSLKIHHNEKGIFKGLEQNFNAGRYHSLVADKVPECFEISAKFSDLVMAVKHKILPINGVQFHPESVLTMKGGNGFKLIKNLIS